MVNKNDPEIKALINDAVNAGLRAGRAQASSMPKDAYKATEKRLYALPTLETKHENDKLLLVEMISDGAQNRSKSIVRFSRSGYRLSPEEMLGGIISDLESTIACDEYEIVAIRCALELISADPYIRTVSGRYMDQMSDEEIAEEIRESMGLKTCDPTTVWRNRKRLVQKLSVWLYGAAAI